MAVSPTNADRVIVRPVTTRREHQVFVRVPWTLHSGDPNWVPPLIATENARWSARHNATLVTRPHWRFIAYRGGRAVGRIAASVDPLFAKRWRPGAGFFGFFESIDDPEVARALLAAAEAQLAQARCTSVLGPVNLTTHDEVGLLTHGFDSPPMLLSPYNPLWYRALLEARGYAAIRRYDSYLWAGHIEPNAVLVRLCTSLERRAARMDLTIRHGRERNWASEVAGLHDLYNRCFASVWGFTPINRQEFIERADDFRKFFREDLVLIAEVHGQMVGFGLVLPDINRVLRKMKGRLLPFGIFRALREVPRLDHGRFILLGVLPEFNGSGLGALLAYRMDAAARAAGMMAVELSLVDSQNSNMTRIIEAAGCRLHKSFHLFARDLPTT
jgi:GNAT superfamily N-acetyltransferase